MQSNTYTCRIKCIAGLADTRLITRTAAQQKMTGEVNMDRHTLPTDLFPEKRLCIFRHSARVQKAQSKLISQKGKIIFFNTTEGSLIHDLLFFSF